MKKPSLKERLSYQFDKVMTKGTVALVGLLFLITIIVILIGGWIASWFVDEDVSIWKSLWLSFNHTIDSGMLGGDEGGISLLLIMFIITICGIFITSMLIGVLSSGLESKFTSLRKGKSRVLENGHVVILGFNDNVFPIISELLIANESEKKQSIVVFGNEDKEVMDEAMSAYFPDTKNTTIICRSGETTSISDLSACSIESCRSVIVNESDDFSVIKTIIATASIIKDSENCSAYMVATVQNKRNVEAAKIAGEGFAYILYFKSTIARIIAHTCNQPGLSAVFTDLFDFAGDEIYFEEFPQFYGKTYQEIICSFGSSSVIGIGKNKATLLNPNNETVYDQGDQLILIAADNNESSALANAPAIDVNAILSNTHRTNITPKENVLFLGYNDLLLEIIAELDHYVADGSKICIATTEALPDETKKLLESKCKKIDLILKECDLFTQSELEALVKDAVSIVLLSNYDQDPEVSDSETLLLLLHLRDISLKKGYSFSITSEMIKVRNQKLAKVARVNDFVISSNITGLMVAQLSQNQLLFNVFEDLLDNDGSEIYMKPVGDYVDLSKPVNLFTAYQAVANRNETMIGYKRMSGTNQSYQITLNPDKQEEIKFTEQDSFIVLSEEG